LETLAAHLGSVIGRSLAEQALRISEEHLRSLLLNAKDFAVYRLKSDDSKPFGLKVLFASPSLKELLGVDNVEDLWEWARNVLPEDLPKILEANQQAFKTHRFEAKGRVQLPGEQKVRWFRAMASGVLDQDGTHYINGMIIDISRNEEAQRALNAYQARLRALALQLSRAEENQRRALAMDLHDGVGQLLAAAKLRLQDVVVFRAGSELARELSEVLNLIGKMIALTRSVTAELSPPVLHDLGLEAALEWLGDRTESEYGLPVDMHFQDRPISLDEDMRVILFRSVRELLHNVVKHASANRAVIALKLRGNRIVVQVSDNGVGFFHPENAERGGPDQRFGLFSIRDRLEYLGGAMQVDSQPGQGAIVTLIAPTRLRT
jgi:signal transduction histidine kinase